MGKKNLQIQPPLSNVTENYGRKCLKAFLTFKGQS